MITRIRSIVGGWSFRVTTDDGQRFTGTSPHWGHMTSTIELLVNGHISDHLAITLDPSEYEVINHEKSC